MSICNEVSAPEIFSTKSTKRSGSRLGSGHIWTFRSLRMRILPSGEANGLHFAKCQFVSTFRHLKIFPPEIRNGRVAVCEVPFWTFRSRRKRIKDSGETSDIPLSKCQFLRMFRHLKNFLTGKLTGRSPFREVTIFGRFGAAGFAGGQPLANPAAYRLQNINFERRFGNLK